MEKYFGKSMLKELCEPLGFHSRGRFFFRVHGDVVQALTFRYEPKFSFYSLDVGLVSLYRKAYPLDFTAQSGITRGSICYLENYKTPVLYIPDYIFDGQKVFKIHVMTPEEQLAILEKKGIAWLNGIFTQSALLEAYKLLDCTGGSNFLWCDSCKLAPFLMLEDYENADRVIASLLNQYVWPPVFPVGRGGISTVPWTEDDFVRYAALYPEKGGDLLAIHHLIANRDKPAIRQYLEENYQENLKKLQFRKRKA